MKKAFDQTVRDLKREVNKKVLKVPGIEQKILDATSNEPWGPHGSTLADIAHATRNSYEYQMIMTVVWKRINDTGKNWRHVYKGLTVLEYLVGNGSERVIDDIKERQYHISTLSDFHYIDSKGRDQGNNVRRKSQSLIALVNDRERIAEAREKASSNRDKFRNTFSSDGNYRSGGRYDDDRYEGRYGSRDDDRNGYGRERNGGYRDDDRYGRYGDRDGRHSEDRYNYQDDDYRGRSRDDNYRYESRSRSADRERVRPYDDDDRYSSRSGGGRSDGPSHEPRPLERKLSDPNISAQPNSEEAANDTPTSVPETKRDEGSSDVPAPKAPLPTQSTASETASTSPVGPALVAPSVPASDGAPTLTANEGDMFDEFDPRGFEPAAPASSSGLDLDLFGSLSAEDSINSLALVPASSSTATSGPDPAISGFESNFVATSVSQPGVNPFGDAPFVASQDDFVAQQQSPAASFQTGFGSTSVITPETAVTAKVESGSGFDFGESFQAVSYASDVTNTQPSPATSGFSPAAVPNQNNDVLDELFPLVATTTSLETQSSLPRAHTAPSELVTESVQPEQSQMQVSQMQVSQMQAPQMQAPQMQAPQMQAPQMQAPQMQAPQMQASQMQASQMQASQMQASQMQASQMQAPQMQAPQMQVPQMQAPQMQAPQMQVLQMQAPQMQAPQMQAPQMQAPQPEPGFLARGSSAPLPPQAAPAYNSQQVLPNTSGIMPKAASLNNLGQLGSSSSSLEAAPASLSGNPSFPQGVTLTTSGAPSKPAEKFETKSTVWADTLSRGLVNLDISGPKANPLADIGVDFDTLNRKEKREEKKSIAAAPVSTITMGKAMGSGSGMGRGNAGAPPPNPMMGSGMGMGMNTVAYGGGGMNQPMGMGMNQGMQQPNPGVPPAAGVPGSIFNPAMGTRGYGSQPYGGYR